MKYKVMYISATASLLLILLTSSILGELSKVEDHIESYLKLLSQEKYSEASKYWVTEPNEKDAAFFHDLMLRNKFSIAVNSDFTATAKRLTPWIKFFSTDSIELSVTLIESPKAHKLLSIDTSPGTHFGERVLVTKTQKGWRIIPSTIESASNTSYRELLRQKVIENSFFNFVGENQLKLTSKEQNLDELDELDKKIIRYHLKNAVVKFE